MEQTAVLERYKWVILILLGALLLAVFAYLALTPEETVRIAIQPAAPTHTHTPTPTVTVTPTPLPVEIYVTGAVANPESRFSLPAGSRVEDAIKAAGGATDDADLTSVNLAQRLLDGDQVHVPSRSEAEDSPSALPTSNAPRPIDLNTATLEELEALPDIGAATAQAILDYREEIGFFRSVDELDNVPGIGETTLEKLRPLVMIDPLALATLAPAPEPTATPALINLNTATLAELDTLPGVGEATAQAIIDYRDGLGGFTSVEQLLDVPGIGEATLERLRPLVTVE